MSTATQTCILQCKKILHYPEQKFSLALNFLPITPKVLTDLRVICLSCLQHTTVITVIQNSVQKMKEMKKNINFQILVGSKPLDASSSNHPSFVLPRPRPKKPTTSATRPFDKLPQQHAPNTRAPGYKGPMKSSKRPGRPNRPFRRESSDLEEGSSNTNLNNWFEQAFDQETDQSTRLNNGEFEEDYEEPNRRVNYNYHPILEFFEPKASMLKSPEPSSTQKSSIELTPNGDGDSWKPMIGL